MAGHRVELLVVLTGTLLLLLSVRGWGRINRTQFIRLYETGKWSEARSFSFPDDIYDNEEEEEEEGDENYISLDAVLEAVGVVTRESFDPFADEVDMEDSDTANSTCATQNGFQVEFVETHPGSWTGNLSKGYPGLELVCSNAGFQITLPTNLFSEVKVLGLKDLLSIMDAPKNCGYSVNLHQKTLTVPFTGCHVEKQTNGYSVQLLYIDVLDQPQISTASCEKSIKFDPGLSPRAGGQTASKCNNPTTPRPAPHPWWLKPTTPPPAVNPTKAQNCAVPTGERVACGISGIASSVCEKIGCCVDRFTHACYYPMDECTANQHFVFAIRHDSASIPVDPTRLLIPGSPECKPVIVNDMVAIFKFRVNECGTRVYEVGEMKIYLAEVQTIVQALNLKYGIITRSDPLRFLVECRYGKSGTAQQSLASVGYMVKTPTFSLPSEVVSSGSSAVLLKIATDDTYTKYLPTYHQPLRLLLGNPVYLELILKSPKPDAVILVNYCLAYPRSAKNALVLIYEGCANPHDPHVSILKVSDLPQNSHQIRFVVKAFQFMDQMTNTYLDEEIYFMCSTEVCRPAEKKCEQRCFDGQAP
ncbi:zona pellucida sperm-binding protein 4-like [Embiotoca jacksoni]|uniref:zona pellucida sperm-binding protein 4-like n=1 Tax=Embiotoca jacksoni TaxID=100190 RepID=UPI0037037AC1